MRTRAAFALALLGLASLTFWIGPRPVFEPWTEELLTPERARALGADSPPVEPLGRTLPSLPPCGEPCTLLDADGDADLDLFAGRDLTAPPGHSRFCFFLNEAGRFREVGGRLGPAFTRLRTATRCWARDANADGRIDLVVELEDGSRILLWNHFEQKRGNKD